VLFHNDSKYILEALPVILQAYTDAGYRVVPVSELLLQGETWIDHAGTQHAVETPRPLETPPPQAEAQASAEYTRGLDPWST
jgi:hypothetical protein